VQAERTPTAWQPRVPLAAPAHLLRSLRLLSERFGWPAAAVAVLFALAARLPYFAHSDFPLNDGGLFTAMSRDLLAGHFALPAFTSYNAEAIPFAYPPIAFYLAAAIAALTGLDVLAVTRWLPLLANLGTVAAVASLARAVVRPAWAASLAAVVFALLPRSYEWMIMGGGLTRSLGYLFAVVCIVMAVRLARTPSTRRLVSCAVLAALALVSHLEEGLFALYSLGLILLCLGGSVRRAVLGATVVGLGTALLTAPWWLTVLARHGLGTFQAASMTSGWSTPGSLLSALGEFLAPPSLPLSVAGSLGVLAAGLCLLRGQPLLPLWLLAIFMLTPRSAPSEAVLPLALLLGEAAAEVVVPSVRRAMERSTLPRANLLGRGRLKPVAALRRTMAAVALVLLLAGVYRLWPRLPVEPFALDSLSLGERQTMAALAARTPADARVLVLSSTESWEEDMAGEWLPVLAGRQSVLTPQGAEWLPGQLHARKVCLFQQVRELAPGGISQLDTWASERGVIFSDIYVSKAARGLIDWRPLLQSAQSAADYTLLLESPEAIVLHRQAPIAPRWPASGEFAVADDCASLADQPLETIATFEGAYGPRAAQAWLAEYEQHRPTRAGLLRLLGSLGGGLRRPVQP